jgi:cell division transport system permease protein
VIAIALTLPGALWISLDNLSQLSGRFQASGSITVYLVPGTAIKDGQTTQKTIAGLSHVVDTRFIDADTALEEFRTTSGLKDALDLLPSNPLPPVIVVEPQLGTPQAQVLALGKSIERLPFVDVVELDTAWLERLLALLALSERIIWVMGALLALAIVLVVGNTIRLSIAARVDEIRVVKLVGGTNAWVRRPFLYTGLWFGMVGGLMAWVLLAICWLLVSGPVEDLAQLYGSTFSLAPLSASAALFLLFSAMFLGWLGAWWSVHRHLDQIEP